MAFIVGDIEGRLTLNRDRFQQGLREARAEARAFEEEGGTRREKVDVDTRGIEGARARLEELAGRYHANVGVDTAEAKVELAAIDRELAKLHRRVSAHVGVDGVAELLGEVEAAQHALDKLDRTRVSPKVDSSPVRDVERAAGSAIPKFGLLTTAILGLGPALVPLGGVAIGAVGGLGAAFGAGGIAAAGFAAVALPTLKEVAVAATKTGVAQQRALKMLGPAARPAVVAFKSFTDAWHGFQRSFQPQIFQLMTIGLNTIRSLLPSLRPMIAAAGSAFIGLARDAQHALQGPFWQQFLHFVAGQAGPAITTLGHVFGNVFHGIAALMQSFGPVIPMLEHGLLRLSQRFASFGSSNAFQHFVTWLQANGPTVAHAVGQVFTAFGRLLPLFATSGVSILKLAGNLARLISAFVTAHPHIAQFAITMLPIIAIGSRIIPVLTGIGRAARVASAAFTAFRAIGGISGVLTGAAMYFQRFTTAILKVGAVVGRVIAPIGRYFTIAFNVVRGAVIGLAAVIGAPVEAVVAAIGAVIAVAVLVATHWRQTKQVLVAIWHGIEAAARWVFNAVKTIVTTEVHAAANIVRSVWHAVSGVVRGIWNGLKSAASAVFNAIKSVVVGATHAAGAVVSAVWNAAKGVVSAAWNGIKSVIVSVAGAIVGFVRGFPGRILHALGNLGGLLLHAGGAIMDGLWNGLKAAAGKVFSFVSSVGSKIKSVFSSVMGIFSPSRVFHGYGQNLMEGLANGIGGNSGLAVAAIDRHARAIKDRLSTLPAHARRVREQLNAELAKLGRSRTFEQAIGQLGDRLESLAAKARGVFIDWRMNRQLAGVDRSRAGRQLARLTAVQASQQQVGQDLQNQDALVQAKATNQDEILGLQKTIDAYKRNLAQAQAQGDTGRVGTLQANLGMLGQNMAGLTGQRDRAVQEAQIQVDQAARQKKIDALTAEVNARKAAIRQEATDAKNGQDRQADAYTVHLRGQLNKLVTSLEQRRISYARFLTQIGQLDRKAGVTLTVPTSVRQPVLAGAAHGGHAPAPRHRPPARHAVQYVHEGDTNVNVTVAGAKQKDPDPRHLGAKLGQELARRKGRRR